jgi:hypothetical protein
MQGAAWTSEGHRARYPPPQLRERPGPRDFQQVGALGASHCSVPPCGGADVAEDAEIFHDHSLAGQLAGRSDSGCDVPTATGRSQVLRLFHSTKHLYMTTDMSMTYY